MTLCANDTWCVAYNRATHTAGITDRCLLCPDCLAVAARDISLLARDHTDLAEHLLPMHLGQWSDGQPGAGTDPPMPIAGHVDALRREIDHSTGVWAEILADHIQATPPTGLSARVSLLAAHTRGLACIQPSEATTAQMSGCEDPWLQHAGVDAITHLRHLHRRALAVTGITTDTRSMPGHCQNTRCGRPALRHDNGSDQVYCGTCGHVITLDDYDRYGNAFLREAA